MSEQNIEKNQPGTAGNVGGTAPGLYQGQGAFVSGGVGGVSNPGASTLGNTPVATLGETTGPNAVNPSGGAASEFYVLSRHVVLSTMFGMQQYLLMMAVRSQCEQTLWNLKR